MRRALMTLVLLSSPALLCGCSSTSDPATDSGPAADLGPAPDTTLPADTGPGGDLSPAPDASSPSGFILLVTETPPGPDNGDKATWRGVARFDLAASGAEMKAGAGIAKGDLADPAGLVYSAVASELFVGNRHGNNSADGTAGSIDRFAYDRGSRTFSKKGRIEGNGLSGVHQLALHPTTGELFAANITGGVSRFTFDAKGEATANGTIADGTTRGVAVSPDGKYLFISTAASVLRRFDLASGGELAPATLSSGNAGLHNLTIHGGDLYATALYEKKIYRLAIDGAGELTPKGEGYPADSPVSVAFSPDGQEMYAAGHRDTDVINRFTVDGDGWKPTTGVSTSSSLGSLIVIE